MLTRFMSDPFVIYTHIEPLCFIPEQNIMLYVSYIKERKKDTQQQANWERCRSLACRRGERICRALPSLCAPLCSAPQRSLQISFFGIFIKNTSHQNKTIVQLSLQSLSPPWRKGGGSEVEHSSFWHWLWSFWNSPQPAAILELSRVTMLA